MLCKKTESKQFQSLGAETGGALAARRANLVAGERRERGWCAALCARRMCMRSGVCGHAEQRGGCGAALCAPSQDHQ